jgi:hypothetical protein
MSQSILRQKFPDAVNVSNGLDFQKIDIGISEIIIFEDKPVNQAITY